ncbi:hypothetical protein I6N98_01275 [Spongiibacter nanhainus]|uniref:Uncharacterized protein n=1 Tax=Spongiibacter nanhainus TaxID=2794344 RepID=A0A7T4R165_9GAMM|nr:hypothetical protein [Spongiibacter nanhainus]QQD18536.1 hypothetical protein I6N98_01275 [Spongiibacter nanhainus]
MLEDKRSGEQPVPENSRDLLTDGQLQSLKRMENFGWSLKFIRQPRCQPPIVVIENPVGTSIAVLAEDGRLDIRPQIAMRDAS